MATVAGPATSTFNIDVHSIVRRWNRVLVEVIKSQSSGISQTMPFDLTRLGTYFNAMEAFQNFIVSQPLLDCPETGPTEIPLPASPALPFLENESAYDVCMLVEIARDEIANSQSARLPTNLMQFDFKRQMDYISKLRNLINYVQAAEPLDLPESSPMVATTGPGRLGVNP